MTRHKLLALVMIAMVVAMGLTACTPQEVEPVNATETPSSSEPIVSSEPEETPSEAVPSDVPVSSDVEEVADIEGEISSGSVDTNNSTGGSNTSKPATTPSSKPSDNNSSKPETTPPTKPSDKVDENGNKVWTPPADFEDPFAGIESPNVIEGVGDGTVPEGDKGIKFN